MQRSALSSSGQQFESYGEKYWTSPNQSWPVLLIADHS